MTWFIPDRIKVGYQNREDTYTGQLAYVIYYDKRGVLRKEQSWQTWRDKKIEPREFANVPTEGFVLNRNGGGGRGWDARRAFIRVYDPRGFEVEIGVRNMLYILEESDCVRGKGLTGQFVYAWEGTELVVAPVGSAEYAEAAEYSDLQGRRVKKKDLSPGVEVLTKRTATLTYLGHHKLYGYRREGGKQHVFLDADGKWVFEKSLRNVAKATGVVHDVNEKVNEFLGSMYGVPVVGLVEGKPDDKNEFFQHEGVWWEVCRKPAGYNPRDTPDVYSNSAYAFEDGELKGKQQNYNHYALYYFKDGTTAKPRYNFGYYGWGYSYGYPLRAEDLGRFVSLHVLLENGRKVPLKDYVYGRERDAEGGE